jgi:hypothetical protein
LARVTHGCHSRASLSMLTLVKFSECQDTGPPSSDAIAGNLARRFSLK